MKRVIGCLTILSLVGCGGGPVDSDIEAKVLSINGHIANGETIGEVCAKNGVPRDEDIRVGIEFKIGTHLMLQDIKLSHAMLAYLKNKKTIRLNVRIYGSGKTEFRVLGYYVGCIFVSSNLHDELYETMQWD